MAERSITLVAGLEIDSRAARAQLDALARGIQPIKISAQYDKNVFSQITKDFDTVNKAIDSATARITSFAATLGVFKLSQEAIKGIASSVIEVDKALTDINVILNASSGNLEKISAGLFNVAKNTGASFKEVATGATELARQGLGAEETLIRINDALILSRLSGLGAAESVEALTTALNSFSEAGLKSAQVANKFAAVDAAFAVSSKDLAQGVSRAGATAQDAGVKFDELLALITSVQQQTGRGGAVISNAFKAIFSRIGRAEVLDQLQELGVQIDESQSGAAKLKSIADALGNYTGTTAQKIKELLGGVYQVNIVSSALRDLSKDSSLYSQALEVSKRAQDEAYERNERLNKSYEALGNAVAVSAQKAAANFGQQALGGKTKNVLGGASATLDFIGENVFGSPSDTDNIGQTVGKTLGGAIAKGIGNAIAGPGTVILATALAKIAVGTAKSLSTGLKALTGVGTELNKQIERQNKINDALSQESEERLKILALTEDQVKKEKIIEDILKRRETLNNAMAVGGGAAATIAFQRGFSGGGAQGISALGGLSQIAFQNQRGGGYRVDTSGISALPQVLSKGQIIESQGLGNISGFSKKFKDYSGSKELNQNLVESFDKLLGVMEGGIKLKADEIETLTRNIELMLGEHRGLGAENLEAELRNFAQAGADPMQRLNRFKAIRATTGVSVGDFKDYSDRAGVPAGEIREQQAAARIAAQERFNADAEFRIRQANKKRELEAINVRLASGSDKGITGREAALVKSSISGKFYSEAGISPTSTEGIAFLKTDAGKSLKKTIQAQYDLAIGSLNKAFEENGKRNLAAAFAKKDVGKSLFSTEIQKIIQSGNRELAGFFGGVTEAGIREAIRNSRAVAAGDKDILAGVSSATREFANQRTFGNTARNFISRNQIGLSIGSSFLAGGFDQLESSSFGTAREGGRTGIGKAAGVGSAVLQGAGVGLAVGGPLGAAIGAGVGTVYGLTKALDDSQDNIDKATRAFEKIAEASTNVQNNLSSYAVAQERLNDSIKSGKDVSVEFFQQLQSNVQSSRTALLTSAASTGIGGKDLSELTGLVDKFVSGTDKERSDIGAKINALLQSNLRTQKIGLEAAEIDKASIAGFGRASGFNLGFTQNVESSRLKAIGGNIAAEISERFGKDAEKLAQISRSIGEDLRITQGGLAGGGAGLREAGVAESVVKAIEGISPENRTEILNLTKALIDDTLAHQNTAKDNVENAKAQDSYRRSIESAFNELKNLNLIRGAQFTAGLNIEQFAATNAPKLAGIGATESTQIDINTSSKLKELAVNFKRDLKENDDRLTEALSGFIKTNLSTVEGKGIGSKDLADALGSGDVGKLLSLAQGQATAGGKNIQDQLDAIVQESDARKISTQILNDNSRSLAKALGDLEKRILEINRLSASFGGNALTANTGDLGARLATSGGVSASSRAQALLEARSLLPNSERLFEGQRAQTQEQIQRGVINQARDVVRSAILETSLGRETAESSALAAGGDISSILDRLETQGDERLKNAIEFARTAIANSSQIAAKQIDKLFADPDKKAEEQFERNRKAIIDGMEGVAKIQQSAIGDSSNAIVGSVDKVSVAVSGVKSAIEKLSERLGKAKDIQEKQEILNAAKAGVTNKEDEDLAKFLASQRVDVGSSRSIRDFAKNQPTEAQIDDLRSSIFGHIRVKPASENITEQTAVAVDWKGLLQEPAFQDFKRQSPVLQQLSARGSAAISNSELGALRGSFSSIYGAGADKEFIDSVNKFADKVEKVSFARAAWQEAQGIAPVSLLNQETIQAITDRLAQASGLGGLGPDAFRFGLDGGSSFDRTSGIFGDDSATGGGLKTAKINLEGFGSSAVDSSIKVKNASEELIKSLKDNAAATKIGTRAKENEADAISTQADSTDKAIKKFNEAIGTITDKERMDVRASRAVQGLDFYKRGTGYNTPGEEMASDAAARLREKRMLGTITGEESRALDKNPFADESRINRATASANMAADQLYDKLTNIRTISSDVTTQLSLGFGNAFTNAVMGAQNFGEAMKAVVADILKNLASQLASAAFAKAIIAPIVGGLGSAFGGPEYSAPSDSANVSSRMEINDGYISSATRFSGGPIGKYAAGGSIQKLAGGGTPVLLNRGEFVASPGMVNAYGKDTFMDMNGGNFVSAGSGTKDDYFTGVAPGSFVVNRHNSIRYGDTLKRMAAGGSMKNYYGAGAYKSGGSVKGYADGGPVAGGYSPTVFGSSEDGMADNTSSGAGITINITLNSDGSASTETSGGAAEGGKDQMNQMKMLASKVKQIIQDETRPGGIISKATGRG